MTVARFWREQKNRYNLLGTKCGNCNKIYFPPKQICKDCHRKSIDKMDSVKLSGNGTIISYTVVHDSSENFKTLIPYALAIIELDEGPRITAQIVDAPESKNDIEEQTEGQPQVLNNLAIGSKVSSVFRKISEDGKSGIIHYGYKFKLVPNNE